MDLHGIIEQVVSFGHNNPIIAIIIGLVFFFLLYRKPKVTLFLLVLVLISAVIYSLIMDTSSSAKIEKNRLINQSEKSMDPDKE